MGILSLMARLRGKIIVMSENTLIKSVQSKIQAKGDKGGEIRSLANLVNVTSEN